MTEDFVGKTNVTTALTTVARRLSLCCDRSEKRHLESSLAILGQRQPNKQCEFLDVGGGHRAGLILRRTTIGAQSVVNVGLLNE